MRPENFLYFLSISGFFIGLSFAVFAQDDPFDIFFMAIMISVVFYMVALASSSIFIHYVEYKVGYTLKKTEKEVFLDKMIAQIEKREKFIDDSRYFIQSIEKEFEKEKKSEQKQESHKV